MERSVGCTRSSHASSIGALWATHVRDVRETASRRGESEARKCRESQKCFIALQCSVIEISGISLLSSHCFDSGSASLSTLSTARTSDEPEVLSFTKGLELDFDCDSKRFPFQRADMT